MGKTGGIELFDQMNILQPDVPVVLLSARASLRSAAEIVDAGAYDLLLKPVDPQLLQLVVARACAHGACARSFNRFRSRQTGCRASVRAQ